ncbi:MAG: glutathione S-transferase family protein [Bosea sp. (in: a-proteobacteria)]
MTKTPDMKLTIYGMARTRTSRVLWMAEELALVYQHQKLVPQEGDTQTASFLALNPMGRVPAIDDDGLLVSESLAINLHLARKYGAAGGFGPRGVGEDALMTQWTLWTATEFEPFTHEVVVQTINLPEAHRDADKRDLALASLARPLGALNFALTQGAGYLVGGRFTVADLNVACAAFYLRAVPDALTAYPAVAAWYAATTTRPAFQRMLALREAG